MVDEDFDQKIEDRINMEIVVDAYDKEERAMGWYYYLQDNLEFPFNAKCICRVSTSPLKQGEIVKVLAMDAEDNCLHDMFVEIKWQNEALCVPLKQLKDIDKENQPLTDWHYWVSQGNNF